MRPLPRFADVVIGGSVELQVIVKNAAGEIQPTPTVSALAQLGDKTTPVNLNINAGKINFEPASVGDWTVQVKSTSPVKAIAEGIVRCHASEIEPV